ncbi:MAG: outer membrane protein assembly factor BamE [Planctomycetota bacterium]|jgi:outer membrane protein assembly factor BamE
MNKTRLFRLLGTAIAIITLSACVYRMDIPQGNRIDAETVQQLEIGMSRAQVDLLMGSPAITDLYQPDRWIYVYYLKNGDTGIAEKRNMTLHFKDDILNEINGSLSPG